MAACSFTAPAPAVNPPGPTCLSAPPTRPADYQRAFDARTGDWAGADGAIDVALPDGRVIWLFGDTFAGVLNGRTLQPGFRMPHNSFQVQTAACFAPQLGGAFTARTSRIAEPAPGEWYWPIDGYVVGNEVRISMYHMRHTDGPPGWDWAVVGMHVATLRLPDLVVTSVTANPAGSSNGAHYGVSTFRSGDWVLQYAKRDASQYVARAPVGQAATGPYEYWDGQSSWTTDPAAAGPMAVPGPTWDFSVVRYGSGFLASGRIFGILSTDVDAWYSPTPQGPWNRLGPITRTVLTPGQFAYGGRVAAELPGTPPMVVSSVNASDAPSVDVLRYGPRFTEAVNLPDPATLAAQYPASP
ncbi:MAG: hypothetical protein ACXW2Y_04485 [Acidimicrobiia bacterium]